MAIARRGGDRGGAALQVPALSKARGEGGGELVGRRRAARLPGQLEEVTADSRDPVAAAEAVVALDLGEQLEARRRTAEHGEPQPHG